MQRFVVGESDTCQTDFLVWREGYLHCQDPPKYFCPLVSLSGLVVVIFFFLSAAAASFILFFFFLTLVQFSCSQACPCSSLIMGLKILPSYGEWLFKTLYPECPSQPWVLSFPLSLGSSPTSPEVKFHLSQALHWFLGLHGRWPSEAETGTLLYSDVFLASCEAILSL